MWLAQGSDPKAATVTGTSAASLQHLEERPKAGHAPPERADPQQKPGQDGHGVRKRLVVAVLQPRTDSKWSVMMGQGWDSLVSLLITVLEQHRSGGGPQ